MKLGVSSYSFRKYIFEAKCDYFKICDLAKKMGFDAIESGLDYLKSII